MSDDVWLCAAPCMLLLARLFALARSAIVSLLASLFLLARPTTVRTPTCRVCGCRGLIGSQQPWGVGRVLQYCVVWHSTGCLEPCKGARRLPSLVGVVAFLC